MRSVLGPESLTPGDSSQDSMPGLSEERVAGSGGSTVGSGGVRSGSLSPLSDEVPLTPGELIKAYERYPWCVCFITVAISLFVRDCTAGKGNRQS